MPGKVLVDIIILSYAKTEQLKNITLNGIETLLSSEKSGEVQFEVLVIESNNSLKPYQYPGTNTIYPDAEFGYNKYMNIGIKATHNDYVCLCNNDLIYHDGWASEILKAMANDSSLLSANPYCLNFHKNEGFKQNEQPVVGCFGVLGGWCIFVKRKVFDVIGPLDENLIFWYCDADYCKTLNKYGIKNCLIPSSFITHLGSESLKTLNHSENQRLTQMPRLYYNFKWHHKSYLRYKAETLFYKIKYLFI